MNDVAVILINYNSTKYTVEAVQTVLSKTSEILKVQIIVVDNNSEIAEYQLLKEKLPKQSNITLHRSIINTGFGGGNMYGAQFANAKYLLFLNNDAMLLNDCLSLLKTYMDANQNVGVCTAQNYDEHNNFVPSFDHNKGLRRFIFGRSFLEKINSKRYPERKKKYTEPIAVDWVNGAFLFFRIAAFEAIGGFDTNIFLYWEEMDVCHRLRKLGFESHLVPSAKILHYQGVSIDVSKRINKESYISYLYVIRKNFGYAKYQVTRLYLTLALLLKPKKWYLLPIVLKSDALALSLKQQQKIRYIYED